MIFYTLKLKRVFGKHCAQRSRLAAAGVLGFRQPNRCQPKSTKKAQAKRNESRLRTQPRSKQPADQLKVSP